MAGLGLFLIAFIVPVITVITVVTFFVYKKIYDKHTTKVLEDGETKKRKWLAPWALTLIVLGAQLLIVAGIMFPLSMFMIDKQAHTIQISSEQGGPVSFDFNYDAEFVHGDDFTLVGEGSNDGITCKIYKKENEDKSVNYYFSGKLDKWEEMNNLQLIVTDESGQVFTMATYLAGAEKDKTFYFELGINVDEYRPSTITIRREKPNYSNAPDGSENVQSEIYSSEILGELELKF